MYKNSMLAERDRGPNIMIVDDNNQIIGSKPIGIAHRQGLYHRCVWIYVVNSKQESLLVRRSSSVNICSGKWFFPGSHLIYVETYQEAARRTGLEELSIDFTLENWQHLNGPVLITKNYTIEQTE
eukprot:TRINITY_DN2181_c0_g1_i1.p1 TRINITY_DN2181_c0_g1~~TRINITY_DN2181_c0_g1_i1.p1  ORF type:complete len:125 (-),score=11.15 TRINITY_DN2181_c0_g1_i1:261-635(-)